MEYDGEDFGYFEIGLGRQFNKSTYADVLLRLKDGATLWSHKPILASRSVYFRDMFSKNNHASNQDGAVITFPQYSLEAFLPILRFLYTDRLRIPKFDLSLLQEMLDLARHLQVPLLEYQLLPKFKKLDKQLLDMAVRSRLWDDLSLYLVENASDSKADTNNNTVMYRMPHSDITILVGDHLFECHKVILASRASYFDRMFRWKWRESTQDVILINDVSPELFEMILIFIYCNNIDISDIPEALEFYKSSQFFQIDSLTSFCEEYIIEKSKVDCNSVCLVWNIAKELNAKDLFEQCKQFFISNFCKCVKSDSFLSLEKSLLKEALTSGDIDSPESTIFDAIFRWGRAYVSKPGREIELEQAIYDMMPPQVLFTKKIKSLVLVGEPPVSFW